MRAEPGQPLRGRLRPPGDKSISHRALIFGLLTLGATEISGLLEGEDILHTGEACRALGAEVERLGEGRWRVRGAGLGSLLAPRHTLDFGNAGTGARLMMGVVAGHGITARFDGDASLRKRPMRRILDPLVLMGAEVLEEAPGGRCPILLKGTPEPLPIAYHSKVASAQVKSAILLAGLNSLGRTTVTEPQASRDHTEKMLALFGADVLSEPFETHGRKITLVGRPELVPAPVVVPGDPSSAAFPLVAALIMPGSEVVIEAMMMNPLRTGLFRPCRKWAAISRFSTAAPRAAKRSPICACGLRASRASSCRPTARPSMIDEYPVLAVAAAFASGETRMCGLSELRVKESDRLAAVAAGLEEAGVEAAIEGDDLIVAGRDGDVPGGGIAATHLDHRIAMSFLCLGLAARKPMAIDDRGMIATSFPTFEPALRSLGARFS